MLEVFAGIICILLPLVAFWGILCNEFTAKHRKKVINDLDSYEIYERYISISYDQHLWRLFLGNWNWKAWYYESK
jgi:hypothetical protein